MASFAARIGNACVSARIGMVGASWRNSSPSRRVASCGTSVPGTVTFRPAHRHDPGTVAINHGLGNSPPAPDCGWCSDADKTPGEPSKLSRSAAGGTCILGKRRAAERELKARRKVWGERMADFDRRIGLLCLRKRR